MRFSILVILYGMVMLSCNEQPKNCKFRTDDMIVKLGAIDDSLEHNSSYSKQIIEKRMTEAIDSMDYYELYLRLCRYYVTSTHPDSAFTGLTNCIYYLEYYIILCIRIGGLKWELLFLHVLQFAKDNTYCCKLKRFELEIIIK